MFGWRDEVAVVQVSRYGLRLTVAEAGLGLRLG